MGGSGSAWTSLVFVCPWTARVVFFFCPPPFHNWEQCCQCLRTLLSSEVFCLFKVWLEAGIQVFYSYGVGLTIHTSLGSCNRFHHNSLRYFGLAERMYVWHQSLSVNGAWRYGGPFTLWIEFFIDCFSSNYSFAPHTQFTPGFTKKSLLIKTVLVFLSCFFYFILWGGNKNNKPNKNMLIVNNF